MKKTLLYTTLAASVCALALPAFAQHHKPPRLENLDTNKDGNVSKDEFMVKPAEHFSKIDTNGDGTISKEEFMVKPTEHFSKMDTNGDGTISKEEAEARRAAMKEKYKERRAQRKAGADDKADAAKEGAAPTDSK